MATDPILQLSFGALAVIATVVLLTGMRARRHEELIRTLADKYSLGRLQLRGTTDLAGRARRFRNRDLDARLKEILVREDDHGRFYLARRHLGRRRWHQVLFFEVDETAYLRGFCVVPVAPASPPRFARGRRRARERRTDWDLHLHWVAPRSHWSEERALSMGARVLYHMADVGASEGSVMLGLDVHERQVVIHSRDGLADGELDRFFADAIRLRRLLLASLRHASTMRPGRRTPSGEIGSPQQPLTLRRV